MPGAGLLFTKQIVKHILKGNFGVLTQVHYYSRWKGTLQPFRSAITDRCPWLSFPAIDFLEGHLPARAKVFEYGGGGSTLFFLAKGARVITVEHDQDWFKRLQTAIPSDSLARWEGHLIKPERAENTMKLDKSRPEDYYSGNKDFRRATFRDYCRFITAFGDEYFDLVLIDGRARSSCLYHAGSKVKPGGWLVLDNAERPHYLENNLHIGEPMFRLVLDKLAAVPYDPFFSKTSIWQRK
jgi:hypothetical protein